MKFKPKFKPKLLLTKAVALFTATTLTFSAFPTTVLATNWGTGNGNGGHVSAYTGDFPYDYESNNLSWRVDMYVSANSNGKIDPDKDKIGSSALPWVGAVLLTELDSATDDYASYLQCDYTAVRKGLTNSYKAISYDASGNPNGVTLNLPHCYQLSSILTEMTDPVTGKKVYVAHDNNELPSNISEITETTYKGKVQDRVENVGFMTEIIDRISLGMGGAKAFLANVITKIKGTPLSKVSEKYKEYTDGDCTSESVMKLIRPDCFEDCVVEWAAVVTPLFAYREHHSICDDISPASDCAFWEALVKTGDEFQEQIIGGDGGSANKIVLDAWWTAQFNRASKTMYSDSAFLSEIEEWNTHVRTFSEMTYKTLSSGSQVHIHGGPLDSGAKNYISSGKLFTEYGGLLANIGYVAHDTHDGSTYCGVATSKGYKASNFATSSSYNEDLMASHGGITVYTNEIAEPEETGIPVYYYIYDEFNEFSGEVYVDSFNAEDNEKAAFKASEEYGIPIAAESYNAIVDAFDKYQDLWNYTGPAWSRDFMRESSTASYSPHAVTDAKGNAFTDATFINGPHSFSIHNEGLKVYSNLTSDFVRSIHVKVIQVPTVDIVYHVYTYTVPDSEYNRITSLKKIKALEEAVESYTPTVTSSSVSFPLEDYTIPYQASSDPEVLALGTPVHVTALLAGDDSKNEASERNDHCPDNCAPGNRNWVTSDTSSRLYKLLDGTPAFRLEPDKYISYYNSNNGTNTRQIHVKIINVKKIPPLGQAAKDRIKTYDVTQLIEDTKQTVEGSPHLTKPASQSCNLSR